MKLMLHVATRIKSLMEFGIKSKSLELVEDSAKEKESTVFIYALLTSHNLRMLRTLRDSVGILRILCI